MKNKKELQCPHCGHNEITGSVKATVFYNLSLIGGSLCTTWESSDEECGFEYISCQNCFEELDYSELENQ